MIDINKYIVEAGKEAPTSKIDINKDIILYHGSKGGIDGDIAPISRARCDFGRGFYMGTDPDQAKCLVAGDDMPYFYKLNFKLSEIPNSKILVLDNGNWLNTILSCRHADPEFDKLEVAKRTMKSLRQFDVIIGLIADDKMREAMAAFIDNALTDKGLMYCLSKVDYGEQIVAKTPEACSKIEILDERMLRGKELDDATELSERTRRLYRNIVSEAKREFNEQGRNFYSYIKYEKNKERNRDVR